MFENLFSLAGRTALVTGGSRGIGKMIAAGFLAHGAKVYISARKADSAMPPRPPRRRFAAARATCISLPHDISSVDGCKALTADLLAREERSTSWSTTPARHGARTSTSSRSTAGTR